MNKVPKSAPVALLSFDVEEFDLPREFGAEIGEEELYEISGDGMKRALEVVEEAGVPVTFFVTVNFARRFPELLARLAAAGEIASHGVSHSSFQPADLAASREALEQLTNQRVEGFRMARLAPVDKRAILAAGYRYESSLNPVYLPGRYNHLGAPLTPFREACGLWQFPVSAVPYCRIPLFWLSFKNFPAPVYRWLMRLTAARTGYFNLYTHPWEYNARAREKAWRIPGYITRHAGQEQADRLAELIGCLRDRGCAFTTLGKFLAEHAE